MSFWVAGDCGGFPLDDYYDAFYANCTGISECGLCLTEFMEILFIIFVNVPWAPKKIYSVCRTKKLIRTGRAWELGQSIHTCCPGINSFLLTVRMSSFTLRVTLALHGGRRASG